MIQLGLPFYYFTFASLFVYWMKLMDSKIGYVPYLADLSQPGDRRRFPYFANRYNIAFEIADPFKKYDVVLLTAPSNLSLWLHYKERYPETRFLFEMVDSLIFDSGLFTKWFKGIGRFLLGKEKNLTIRYTDLILKWIRIADVVICSNEVLRQAVLETNEKAILSPDYLESEYRLRKDNFEISGKMKLVWEGQSVVLPHFLAYRKLLAEVSDFCELHIISNPSYPVIPKLYSVKIDSFLKKLPIKTHFHEWTLETHNVSLIKGDCAIIPLDPQNEFGWNKPANKLVSFWFCGLPTVVSDTPAYRAVMDHAKSPLYCHTEREWVDQLRKVFEMAAAQRAAISQHNYDYTKNYYSDDELDKIWERIFSEVN